MLVIISKRGGGLGCTSGVMLLMFVCTRIFMCMFAMPWRIEVFLGFGKVGWFGNVNKMAGIRFLDIHGRKELVLLLCWFARLGMWVGCFMHLVVGCFMHILNIIIGMISNDDVLQS